MDKFETISNELIFSNPYWDYRKDIYVLPNGKKDDYYYVDSRGSCIIIPMLDNNTFIMVRQYRYPNRRFGLEFPGGGLSKGKTIFDNASDELRDEAGYRAGKFELLGEFNPCNGMTNEICSVFFARNLSKTESYPDFSEEFEILSLTENEIYSKIKNNEIWDGMTLASWSLFQFSKIRRDLNL